MRFRRVPQFDLADLAVRSCPHHAGHSGASF